MDNTVVFSQTLSHSSWLQRRDRHVRPWFALIAGLIVSGAILLSLASTATASMVQQYRSLSIDFQPVARQVASQTAQAAPVTPANTANTSAPIQPAAPSPKAAAVVSIPNCTPAAKVKPAALDLTAAASGLSQQIDNPTQYQIYGNTISDLQQQIQRCSPAGGTSGGAAEYTAQNNYNLSWRYYYRIDGNACTINDVKVGLHVSMDMPLWQPTSAAKAGLPAAWNNFTKNLKIHEDGHTTISQQHAQALIGDLQNIGTVDCATLAQTVQQTADRRMTALNQAQEAYDAQTDHGATQGAVMPR